MPQPFHNAVMTNAGARLLSRAQTGEIKIEFTRIAVGDGSYLPEEKTLGALQKRTTLKSLKNSYTLSNIDTFSDHSVKVTALITNQNPVTGQTLVTAGYYINEMGLFAKIKGGADSTEVLYSITTTTGDNGDFMPPYNGYNPAQIIQDYFATVNNSAEITIQMNTGAVALVEDLDATYQKAAGYTDQKIADLIGGAPETLDTLKEVADAIEENEDVVSALNAAIGNKANQAELDTHTGNGTIHVTATEKENWSLCGTERKTDGKTNIEYLYPIIEAGACGRVFNNASLAAALKNATSKISKAILGITPEDIGALPLDGNAASATMTAQDGNGDVIADTYLKKINGDSSSNLVYFNSYDKKEPDTWLDTNIFSSGTTHRGLFTQLSIFFRNVRYLYKMLGTTDISGVGDGTVTGAVKQLGERLGNYMPSSAIDYSSKYDWVRLRTNNEIMLRYVTDFTISGTYSESTGLHYTMLGVTIPEEYRPASENMNVQATIQSGGIFTAGYVGYVPSTGNLTFYAATPAQYSNVPIKLHVVCRF